MKYVIFPSVQEIFTRGSLFWGRRWQESKLAFPSNLMAHLLSAGWSLELKTNGKSEHYPQAPSSLGTSQSCCHRVCQTWLQLIISNGTLWGSTCDMKYLAGKNTFSCSFTHWIHRLSYLAEKKPQKTKEFKVKTEELTHIFSWRLKRQCPKMFAKEPAALRLFGSTAPKRWAGTWNKRPTS